MSILNLYCLMKASTKSFHFLTLVLFNHIYQVRAAPLKLSWKKWINNFSSSTTSAILLQYALRWVTGHWVLVYLMNSGTLNFLGMTMLGTKPILTAFTRSHKWFPLTALILSSRAVYFLNPLLLPSCLLRFFLGRINGRRNSWGVCWLEMHSLLKFRWHLIFPQIPWIKMSYMHIFKLSYKYCFSGFISQGLLE